MTLELLARGRGGPWGHPGQERQEQKRWQFADDRGERSSPRAAGMGRGLARPVYYFTSCQPWLRDNDYPYNSLFLMKYEPPWACSILFFMYLFFFVERINISILDLSIRSVTPQVKANTPNFAMPSWQKRKRTRQMQICWI